MGRARAQLLDSGEMGAGGVTLVTVEAVGGVPFMQLAEQPVAMDLGENGGGGDGNDVQVASGEAQLGKVERLELDPVEEQVIGAGREGQDGAAHGKASGWGDTTGVDFGGRCFAKRPRDSLLLNAKRKFFTLQWRQKLAILDFGPEPGAPGVYGQNYGTGHYGTGERAASGLVQAGNTGEASAPQFSLFREGRVELLWFPIFFAQLRYGITWVAVRADASAL